MPSIRLIFLWHMHQPFYKDLVSGQYRLPWVRMHALKDYYGMVKLLDEFPEIHQNFNLVPSLITQIDDYVSGTSHDLWREIAAKPAAELNRDEQKFALSYFFHANQTHQIGRYPRYLELLEKMSAEDNIESAIGNFSEQDFTDLQVLSQLAWFDEFFLEEPEIASLIKRQRGFSPDDQRLVADFEQRILAAVIPAYQAAADRGAVELSTTPFYHPILPLLCDTNNGRVSSPGLPLPRRRYLQSNDALEQMQRAISLHEQTFGSRPAGMWPSEGSVSNEVLALARQMGLKWLATDEGVLGRSTHNFFERDSRGTLTPDSAQRLYAIYRCGEGDDAPAMVFRDHSLSDLIGFVYSGMPAQQAATHFIDSVKSSAAALLDSGRDATVSVILDGENAWEHFPESGREFLRWLYEGIQSDPQIEPLTISEAIARTRHFGRLHSLVPGSWINANFNVWIGALEDNLAWDYLAEARDFYSRNAEAAEPEARRLAYEELLIAEGSDWNWWYGPEHSSANDRDFDELYRNHLANVYRLLGGKPPDSLQHPILTAAAGKAQTVPQTAFIQPNIASPNIGYFDWLGAASYSADRRTSAMHGKKFLLERAYAGIGPHDLYLRLDLACDLDGEYEIDANIEILPAGIEHPRRVFIARFSVADRKIVRAYLTNTTGGPFDDSRVATGGEALPASIYKTLRTQVPLSKLGTEFGDTLLLRFSLSRGQLPLDALPQQGWMELAVLPEEQMLETGDYAW